MSIQFTGDKTALRRTTSLPSAHNAFTLCGFAKLLTAAPARQATIAYTQTASLTTSVAEAALLAGASGTGLRAADNYYNAFSPDVATVTAGGAAGANWFFWALVGVGYGASGLRIYHKPVGSGSLAFQAVLNSASATPPDNTAFSSIQFGDAPYGTTYWFNGLLAHLKVYNRALSAAELTAEAGQGAPVSTVSLLSYHSFADASISTAIEPNQGFGTFGYMNSAPATSADMPVFGAVLTGLDTLPIYAGPIWGTANPQTATVGIAFSYAPILLSGADVTYSKASGPGWANVNASNGVISGTPTGAAGSYSIVVRATNSSASADLTVPVTVSDASISSNVWTRVPRDAEVWIRVPRTT
jgi:hypothetical protein